MIRSVEDLDVFKKAHELTLALYRETASFPLDERFGLSSQIRRAAVSIDANSMEGSHRASNREYHRFASISRGSTGELKYLIRVSHDLGYIEQPSFDVLSEKTNEISRMLEGLLRALGSREGKPDGRAPSHSHT